MNIDEIVSRLKNAHNKYDPVLKTRKKIIEEEVELLLKFVGKIFPFTTKKNINGKNCVLIYVFPKNNNHLISDDVYLSPDGYITYQVFDEVAYRGIVPNAVIENGYVKVPIDYFLETVPLIKILKFFEQRPSILLDRSFEISELNKKRQELINKLKKIL